MPTSRNPVKALIMRTKLGERYFTDVEFRVMLTASLSFALNIIFAIYHQILGSLSGSVWFVAMSGYYIILGAMRIGGVLGVRKNGKTQLGQVTDGELATVNFCGILLIALAFEFAAAAYFSFTFDIATRYEGLTVISAAVYTALRIFFAVRNMILAHKIRSPWLSVMRNISCADAAASAFVLLRSLFLYKYIEMHIHHLVPKIFALAVFFLVLTLGIVTVFNVQRIKRSLGGEEK